MKDKIDPHIIDKIIEQFIPNTESLYLQKVEPQEDLAWECLL